MDANGKSRPRVLFVHGAGGGGWEWALWARVAAARGWDAVAPDLMPAPGGLERTTFDDYAAQVRAWCAATAPQALVGASLGGLLALAAAATAPPRRLVLINPLPPAGIEPRPTRDAPWPAVVPWGRSRAIDGTRRALPDADAAACLLAFRRWRDESGAVLRSACAGVAVGRVDAPLLVLASGADADVPPAASAAVAARYGGTCTTLSGASHVGPLLGRDAAAVAARTFDWIDGT